MVTAVTPLIRSCKLYSFPKPHSRVVRPSVSATMALGGRSDLTPLKVRKRFSAIAGLPTTPQQTKKRHVSLDEEDVKLWQEFCRQRKGEISEEVQELESRIAALKAKKRALEVIEEESSA